jgi:hypothetical protein
LQSEKRLGTSHEQRRATRREGTNELGGAETISSGVRLELVDSGRDVLKGARGGRSDGRRVGHCREEG